MFQKLVSLIGEEFRPKAAFNNVAKLSSYHRIQCSPGFRDAAHHIHSFLVSEGIRGDILTFPARSGMKWWSQVGFEEWACRDAELVLLEDGKREQLCSYAESKTSLIQRSAPSPARGIETSIVYVENATEPSAYEGTDVAGKIVFSRGNVTDIARVAVDRFGAAGIIVDTMREHAGVRDRFDLPDGRQYLAFWPAKADSHRAFGFVLTPRQGEALRKRFAAGKKELAAFARVDTGFYSGSMEVVTAVIPGESDEEVVAIAHLCHPEPSANDNASGAGALMEVARTLARLVGDGRLPRPRRTIRLLWLPEMTGSYAYLATQEDKIGKVVAAINLDMVGENQDLCKSTFIVEKPPKALPGFGGDLAESVLRLMAQQASNYGNTHSYATFRWTVSPFSGGSDHNIWGDPSVGVTCPLLIQWPDRFYHTSEDTIDKVDPRMLGLAGVLTAAYLYAAASATPATATYLAGQMATHFIEEAEAVLASVLERAGGSIQIAPTAQEELEAVAKARRAVDRRVSFLEERKKADIDSLLRLAQDSPLFAAARASACGFISSAAGFLKAKALGNLPALAGLSDASDLPPAWEPPQTRAEKRAHAMVLERVFRGPFSSIAKEAPKGFEEEMQAFGQKYSGPAPSLGYLQYWTDGKRSLAQVADLVECETGFRDTEMLLDYVGLMVKRGVFRVREGSAP